MNISATYRSDYVNLSTVRIVHEAVERIREVSQDFLGMPNNPQLRNALDAECDTVLRRLQDVGALDRYEKTLVSSPSMRVLGQLRIQLKLVPAFEIIEIEIETSLAKE